MSPVREQKKEKTRQRLIRAAWELFCTQGVAETTVAQITERAMVGTGTFYNYFKTKVHALSAHLDERIRQAIGNYHAHPQPEDPIDAIEDVFRHVFEVVEAEKRLLREAMAYFFKRDQSFDEEFEKADLLIMRLIADVIENAQAQNRMNPDMDPMVAAMTVYSVYMFGWMAYLMDYYPDVETTLAANRGLLMTLYHGLKGGVQ